MLLKAMRFLGYLVHYLPDISISKGGQFISFAGSLYENGPSGANTSQIIVVSRVDVGTGAFSQVKLCRIWSIMTNLFGDGDEYLSIPESIV